MQQKARHVLSLAALCGGCLLYVGCSPDKSQEASMRDRQDAAMRDPFHYAPNMDQTDVSGGGVGSFDKKAFGKDLNDVINP